MDAVAFRLKPQQDLRLELEAFVHKQNLEAACILTCVGSLTQATLRLAGQSEPTPYKGKFEIVSLTGLMSKYGSHYHISIANDTGQVYGGHVLAGCLIYTTAEIVVGVIPNLRFRREYDSETGYAELTIDPNN